MTPNLKRLFEQSKYNGRYDGTDSTEILECERAQDKIHNVLATHGEALIEALDEFNTWYGMKGWDARELELTDRISKLLAQLESEAQL